jgi:hypothetical protein
MAKKVNFVLKVTDAKLLDIKKALEAKSIKLDSIIEDLKRLNQPLLRFRNRLPLHQRHQNLHPPDPY